MDARLALLVEWIHRGGLRSMPAPGVATESALDLRDEPPFDPEWVRANDEVHARLRDQSVPTGAAEWFDAVAEAAFLACAGNTAIAPYVSDDFRLIAEALLAGDASPWVAGLLATYECGQFPSGVVRATQRSLEEIVRALG